MKLYATTTSERASKGQGGNKRLDILVSDSERFEVVKLYFQINEDNTATLRYWDRTMSGDGFTSLIHLSIDKTAKR